MKDETLRARRKSQRLDRFVDQVCVVDVVLFRQQQQTLQRRWIEVANLRLNLHIAEMVQIALIDREGDVEIAAVRREFGDCGYHPKIGVAAGEIETA